MASGSKMRTQVSLPTELDRVAKDRAAQSGISLAEYIRRLVARDLDRPARHGDATAVFDLGTSDGSDVARNKDRYVGEAVQASRSRELEMPPD